MKRQILLVIVTWLGIFECSAQYDVAFGNYWALQSFYNPAVTGKDGKLNVQGAYSMQMSGFENAPASMYAGVDLPIFFLSPRHGIGVGFLNDEVGLFSHKKFSLQYAYHHKLWGGTLSGGVQFAFLSEGFDGSKIDLGESNDPAFPTSSVTGSGFDLGAGFYYAHKNWYLGFSALHCTSPVVEYGEEKIYEINILPTFYLMGGYNIKLKNPLYTIHSSAILRSDMVGYRADLTGRVAYNGSKYQFYGGLSYSPTNSVSFLFGGNFHGVSLGYSYEMYTSSIGAMSGGHEIVLGYQTDLNLFKKGKNKHKSIRIL